MANSPESAFLVTNSCYIALLVESATSWGSRIIQGAADFSRTRDNWYFYFEPHGHYERLHIPPKWNGQGVIARVIHEALADEILERNIPAVNTSWYDYGGGRIARCTVSEEEVGRHGCAHLLDCGLRNFGYCGPTGRPGYVDRVCQSFQDELARQELSCHVYEPVGKSIGPANWQREVQNLAEWLTALPYPVGVMAFSGPRALQVSQAARLAKLDVPDRVAILMGEHDELASQVAEPHISSVDQSSYRVGYEAAALLERLMAGEQVRSVWLPSAGVVVRRSTDTLAVDDPAMADVMRFIRRHARRPITVDDIVSSTSLSRRQLERRFRDVRGRSPAEELRKTRLEIARRLLIDTNQSVTEVALASGFEYAESLTRVFSREMGFSPGEYRRNMARHELRI